MSDSTAESRLGRDPFAPRLAAAAADARLGDLDARTLEAARWFLADSLAVGVAGLCNPAADKVFAAMRAGGEGAGVSCLGRPEVRLHPYQAAVVNGFLIHCLEWDALHEPSVVIAPCATMGALSCDIQERGATLGDLLLAFVVGVETAVFFGSAAASPPRFFRPSAAGVMGAAAAIGSLRGFDRARMHELLGLAYSQAGGTMQAHWEGADALAVQVGFASRAALGAADLVAAGVKGPHDVVSGRFGYFALFETPGDIEATLAAWAKPWKMVEVAHKPFPAGRATQATLTALLALRADPVFRAEDVVAVRVDAPPLIRTLVDRPYRPDMSPSYARLCLQYIVPRMLLEGDIDPRRFAAAHFPDPDIAALAPRVVCVVNDNPDPNALGPQTVTIELRDGTRLRREVDVPLGAPGNPLTRAQRIDKIARCFAAAGSRTDPAGFMEACETLPLSAPAAAVLDALN